MMRPLLELGKDVCADLERLRGASGWRRTDSAASRPRRSRASTRAATTGCSAATTARGPRRAALEARRDTRHRRSAPRPVDQTSPRRRPPRGYTLLESFRLDPFPVFTYEVEDIEIRSPSSCSTAKTRPSFNINSGGRGSGAGAGRRRTRSRRQLSTQHSALSTLFRAAPAHRVPRLPLDDARKRRHQCRVRD